MRRMLVVALLGLFFAPFASAAPLASAQVTPSSATPAQMTINLGHSAAALNGPWKFSIGDNPAWSSPAFDDSSWETTSLETKAGSYDPGQGNPGFVPGWTGKGHPGYSGYAWYRIRIRITGADAPISILASSDVDDSYQLFVNGRLLGSFGDFSGSLPTVYVTQPRMFQIPASLLRNSPEGNLDIAFRFYMAPRELLQNNFPGGMHDPPYVGFTDVIAPAYHVQWEGQYLSSSSAIATFFIYLVFTLLIVMLYAFDRAERILLLPLAACGVFTLYMFVIVFSNTTMFVTAIAAQAYAGSVMVAAFVALWAITWWAYFGLQQKKWIRNAIVIVAILDSIIGLLFPLLTTSGPSAPRFIFTAYSIGGISANVVSLILSILIAYFGIRKAQKIDWMLLLALIFFILPNLNPVYQALHIRTSWFPFGLNVPLSLLTSLASLFCFSIVLLRRFRASQRRQQATLEDIKQAQEVQQVLIPEELPRVPGLAIESEYRPAREVGGDFFQIIPHSSDGSVLVIVGDVTGKGLQAGMLVALIVGTIRTAVENSFDPLDVLQALNRRLYGRGNACATCLALRIAADGSAKLANGGHLPPYLNGKELPMDGALPLGMVLNAEFSVMRFTLAPDDRLTLISDGVVEAYRESGQLFGFERIRALLEKRASVAEIATAAQSFGQQDDISVIAITRTAVREHAVA